MVNVQIKLKIVEGKYIHGFKTCNQIYLSNLCSVYVHFETYRVEILTRLKSSIEVSMFKSIEGKTERRFDFTYRTSSKKIIY